MTAWDVYLQQVTSKVVCRATLCGQDGQAWAGGTQVKVTKAEVLKICDALKKTPGVKPTGLFIEGTNHLFISAETRLLVLKNRAQNAVLALSAKAVLIVLTNENPTAALKPVKVLIEELVKKKH